MPLIDEVLQQTNGARFIRADLHIHSFGEGGSYDVSDNQMTPDKIIDLAISEKIKVISITDHNEITNVKVGLDYASGKEILVIPGVELSTTEGHLLVYLPDWHSLRSFFGKLTISSDKKLCNHTIVQCLSLSQEFGGFGVAAHIELDSGFEVYMKGYTPFKTAVVNCPNLLGLEISSSSAESWFTDRDTSADRKRLLGERRQAINEDNTYDFAKVMSSDAHTLSALGKNAAGNRKITRLKMDSLDFHSFKIAFMDSSARIRLEDLIPPSIPCFIGVKFDGGFLDGQIVRFSKNLTCIIGGRGAGKSTVLESVRASSGNGGKPGLVDNEVWAERISLVYEDETGRTQVFTKDKAKNTINSTDVINGITQVHIESFGQGETTETIQHCDKDPGVLVRFFDGFIDFGTLKTEDDQVCQELLDNQTLIERTTLEVNTIAQVSQAKNNAEEQVNALKGNNAKEVVELEQSLANERALRGELVSNLGKLLKGIYTSFEDKTLFNTVLGLDEKSIVIGNQEFKDVKQIIEGYQKKIDAYSGNIKTDSQKVNNDLKEKLSAWAAKEKESLDKIEEIRKQIEAKGAKLDLAFIRKVTQDLSDYNLRLIDLKQKEMTLKSLNDERKKLVEKRKKIKQEIYKRRYAFVTKINSNLKSTVVDFNIDIKIHEGVHSPALATIIKNAMEWRTSQVPKADLIARQLSFNALLEAIEKGDSSRIKAIKSGNAEVFVQTEAEEIIRTLKSITVRGQIDRCSFDDLIEISLTRQGQDNTGKPIFIKKDFSKLSLGQQQSIVLSILLFSNKNCPLLIDQPEDNLDSEFIYKTLVKNLRRIKEHRQVIIVTHNANIAVLGDAELIVPLKSTSEKSVIMDRGSIDNPLTKKITCAILEGGEKAFIKRKELYNI